jgi:repressor LexA
MNARVEAPNLTVTQMRVYTHIRLCIEHDRCPPTIHEIANHFGWRSPNAAQEHVNALVQKGLITRVRGVSRNIRLVELPVLQAAT